MSAVLGLLALQAVANVLNLPTASAQVKPDDHDDSAPIKVGYAIVTPSCPQVPAGVPQLCTATPTGMVVFETFGLKRGAETAPAAVFPATMTTRAALFVNTSTRLSRDIGVAIVNPGTAEATLTLTLSRWNDGMVVGTRSLSVPAKNQITQFVTQLFSADQPLVIAEFDGTLTVSSNTPVAVIGLRFRGANFSTLPVTSLSAPTTIPQITSGVGGPGAVILPQFAVNGGWSSEIVVLNTGMVNMDIQLDLFKSDGTRLPATLNGARDTASFRKTIRAGGMATIAPTDENEDSRF